MQFAFLIRQSADTVDIWHLEPLDLEAVDVIQPKIDSCNELQKHH